jgi:O-methyltransferase
MNEKSIDSFQPYTLLSGDRLRMIYQLARSCEPLAGDAAELGVYRGGVSMMLSTILPAKTVYAFDTFEGIPNADAEHDRHSNGDFSDVGLAIEMLLSRKNISLQKGRFPETTGGLRDLKFSFAHFDGDTYQSCVDFIAFFRPRMTAGGIMVFDDYKWENCPGVEEAVHQAFADGEIIVAAAHQCFIIAR